MSKKYQIRNVWSVDAYKLLATDIELAMLDLLKKSPDYPSKIKPRQFIPAPTSHRIEQLVREMSLEYDEPMLHVGLTSSDIDDNIRAEQIRVSAEIIRDELGDLINGLEKWINELGEDEIIGRTHLLPARVIKASHRFLPVLEALKSLDEKIHVEYKGIGGAVGDNYVLNSFGVSNHTADQALADVLQHPISAQSQKNQTSNMRTEANFIAWCGIVASYLSQLAYNLRLSIAFGDLIMRGEKIGSSAMPHKTENPWRLEKICGLSRRVYQSAPIIMETIANNGLERTLDNQSILREECEKVSETMIEIMELFELEKFEINPERSLKIDNRDDKFIKLIKKGYCRTDAQHLASK